MSSTPSAELLERLTERVRRNPGASEFVDLGRAYLALGRPRDAIDVGARGLKADPANLDGRMVVSQAFVELHQWKQAQAELLKVVKTDRTNSEGFRMLGEVLMRRSDYERALPVLQHAQNLDPANPGILSLLKRARAGQPLDPPPPIPTPRAPAAAAAPPRPKPPLPRPGGGLPPEPDDNEPTRVAGGAALPDIGDDTDMVMGPATEPGMPTDFEAEETGQLDPEPIAARMPLPPSRSQPPSPPRPAPPARAKRPSAPPPPQAKPKVRPRILAVEKPKDAARAGLRQSAAMGEDYLNNLLTQGLLDVPNVRVPETNYDLNGGKRWGRSAKRAYIVLFVMLAMGVGGGTTWYFYAKKQRAEDVARHLGNARTLLGMAKYDDTTAAMREVKKALDRDKSNVYAMAVFAEVGGISSLLYKTEAERTDLASTTVEKEIKGDKSRKGYREVLIGRSAVTIAMIHEIEKPVEKLTDVRAQLGEWIGQNPEDLWAIWLRGKARMAAGDRKGAKADFEKVKNDPKGPLVATIDLADMALDDGDYTTAMKLYEEANTKAPNHPLVLIGRSLARAERGTEATETMDDLKVGLNMGASKGNKGPRVEAYKNLALAMSNYAEGQFKDFEKSLKVAIGLREPRFLARVAMLHAAMGRVKKAAELRARIRYYGKGSPQVDPLVAALDAEMLLSAGLSEPALKVLDGVPGLRAHVLRGRALLGEGDPKEALAELEKAAAIAPDDRDTEMWSLLAKVLATRSAAALKKLRKLAAQSNSKAPTYVYALALLRRRALGDARRKLESSLEDISEDHPNPLAYRAHVALAKLDYKANKWRKAAERLKKALELNPSYLPAHGLLGLLHAKSGNHAEAVDELLRLVSRDVATGEQYLAFAESMVAANKKLDERQLELTRKAIKEAHAKKVSSEALAKVAWAVDKKLAEELGLSEPDGDDDDDKKRRRRR